MAEYNVLSKRCPSCRETAVVSIDNHLSTKRPTHRCTNCGAELKTSFSRSVLWAVPACIISLIGMYAAITWLNESQMVTGAVRAGLSGGIAAVAFSIPANVALRGIVFSIFKSSRNTRSD